MRTLQGIGSISFDVIFALKTKEPTYDVNSLQTSMNTLVERVIKSLINVKPLICRFRRTCLKDRIKISDSLIWGQITDTTVKLFRQGATKVVKPREADIGVKTRSKDVVNNLVWNLGRIALGLTCKDEKCNVGAFIVRDRLDIR